MLLNEGYKYATLIGTCFINEEGLVDLKDHTMPHSISIGMNYGETDCLAFRFANLAHDEESVLNFCQEYGLLFPKHVESFLNCNDDLFSNSSDYGEKSYERIDDEDPDWIGPISLDSYYSYIKSVRTILGTFHAVLERDSLEIIKGLLYFILVPSEKPKEEYFASKGELFRIKEAFAEFLDWINYDPEFGTLSNESLHNKICAFVRGMLGKNENYPDIREDVDPQMDLSHKCWRVFFEVMDEFLDCCEVQSIDPKQGVVIRFIRNDDIIYFCSDRIRSLGFALLRDYFKQELIGVNPYLEISDGMTSPNLKVRSLWQAINLQLFCKMNPYNRIRKCGNPTCNRFFDVPAENIKKKYCSNTCSLLMAKRMQRDRERKKRLEMMKTDDKVVD